MRKLLLVSFIFFTSCKPSSPLEDHFTRIESDSLLVNIITYNFQKAPYASNQTRFESKFRNFYVSQIKNFRMERIELLADSSYLFLMIRPVGSTNQFSRGVIGKFKLSKGSMMPIDYEEIVNTPHLKKEVVKERGDFLFREYLKTQNLDKYLGMKDYIEWPDSSLVYDKKVKEWVSPKYLSK